MDFIGYDWAGVVNVFVGILLLTSDKAKHRGAGFFSMLVANVFFFLYGREVGSEALQFSSVLFFGMNLYGIVRNIMYESAGK